MQVYQPHLMLRLREHRTLPIEEEGISHWRSLALSRPLQEHRRRKERKPSIFGFSIDAQVIRQLAAADITSWWRPTPTRRHRPLVIHLF